MKWISDKMQAVWKNEDGLGTLEILLIVAVLVGVALLFRNYIVDWVTQVLNFTDNQIDTFDPANMD